MKDTLRQILNVVFGITQLAANTAGGAGLIGNSVPIGEISDRYFNAFTPAGYTFAVWGPIYLGITAYVVYQALPGQRTNPLLRCVGWWTASAAAANTLWTPVFTQDWIGLSLLVIVWLLVSLAIVFVILRDAPEPLTQAQRWLVQIPFSAYFAWVTVATIANAAALLTKTGWNGFGISGPTWSAALMIVAGLITCGIVILAGRSGAAIAYVIVLDWALGGIFNGQSAAAVTVTSVVVGLLVTGFLAVWWWLPASRTVSQART